MPIHDRDTFEAGAGLNEFEFAGIRPCDDPLLPDFLQALSARILAEPQARQYPDLMTFGYFCRRASVKRAQAAVSDLDKRMGWGTVVHIAPSNIPINFAFSFVMGFLAGNSNIVRLPTKAYPQMALLVQLFDELAAQPQFAAVGRQAAFVQTDRDSPWLEALVTQSQGIVVWGGDATVERFRRIPKAPRCVEVYFPNRVSSVVLDAQACIQADAATLLTLGGLSTMTAIWWIRMPAPRPAWFSGAVTPPPARQRARFSGMRSARCWTMAMPWIRWPASTGSWMLCASRMRRRTRWCWNRRGAICGC